MLSKDGINLIALGAKPNKLVLDKDKQKRLKEAEALLYRALQGSEALDRAVWRQLAT